VTLLAISQAGWHFDHWEGQASGSAISATIIVNADASVTAVFVEDAPA